MTEEEVREIVKEEVDAAIASLAGLALRRLQDVQFTRSFERNAASDAAREVFGHLWGEVLSDYQKAE